MLVHHGRSVCFTTVFANLLNVASHPCTFTSHCIPPFFFFPWMPLVELLIKGVWGLGTRMPLIGPYYSTPGVITSYNICLYTVL